MRRELLLRSLVIGVLAALAVLVAGFLLDWSSEAIGTLVIFASLTAVLVDDFVRRDGVFRDFEAEARQARTRER